MIGTDIAFARRLLEAGELVGIPTETVYGLAANALDLAAVARVFTVKNRPSFDPLIIHTSQWERVGCWVKEIPDQAAQLAEAFLPGPLTLLLPKRPIIDDLVTAGSPLVAVRVPRHPMTHQLLQQLDFPLAAPSANPFGYISPTTARHVADQLGQKVRYVLDGGPCQVGLESTIVGFEEGRPVIYRKGGIAIEAINALLGPVEVKAHSTSNPKSPGMLKSHYAPRTPLYLGALPELYARFGAQRIGVIAFKKGLPEDGRTRQMILSPSGDLAEAAQGLFSAMRKLDQLKLDLIIAEPFPDEGLGRAINDRLRRAAV